MGRRLAPGNPFQTGECDGFVEVAEALRGEKVGVPRGVYRCRTFEEALEWEERMLRGEVPGGERRGHGNTAGPRTILKASKGPGRKNGPEPRRRRGERVRPPWTAQPNHTARLAPPVHILKPAPGRQHGAGVVGAVPGGGTGGRFVCANVLRRFIERGLSACKFWVSVRSGSSGPGGGWRRK